MALVFRTNTEAPVECAMEIARALKSHPAIQLRMGIHSGPVNEVVDVNQRANIAGAGINMAQRVMDCGIPDTSCSPGTWPKISNRTIVGGRSCMILANAK